MLYLVVSDYKPTLFKSNEANEVSDGLIETMTLTAPQAFYTKTPEEYSDDLLDGWVDDEEWVYVDNGDKQIYVKVDSIHQLDDADQAKLEDEYGPAISLD